MISTRQGLDRTVDTPRWLNDPDVEGLHDDQIGLDRSVLLSPNALCEDKGSHGVGVDLIDRRNALVLGKRHEDLKCSLDVGEGLGGASRCLLGNQI